MKEYRVEFTQIEKKYACVVVKAESRKQAIEKARSSDINIEDFDENETAARSQWTASSCQGFFDWISSAFKG